MVTTYIILLYIIPVSNNDLRSTEFGECRPLNGLWSCVFVLHKFQNAGPSGRTVCGRSPAEILGSNLAEGMDVCLF
jgi:hypothetical protein